MKLRLLLCAALGLLALPSAQGQDNGLGRLFFSAEKRALMDLQRLHNIQETQTLEGAAITLNGTVIRSSGHRTVWINDRPQHDDQIPQGVAVHTRARTPGEATLDLQGEVATGIKVGESVNRATRERSNAIPIQMKP